MQELYSLQRPERTEGTRRETRTKVTLVSDDPAKKVIWAYWPPSFPLSYDFKVATGPGATVVAFAKNYAIGVFDPVESNTVETEQPSPHYIDLKELVGEAAFAPDEGVVMNALTRNLRIEQVSFDKTWHITIRGKGGKRYEIVGHGANWSLGK